eukprot:TRINITY_DN11215_c0_g2_i3.p2 TRINITY_DN11215_c0_g2~~TRINITY_DN11215_c0_g2_i3.p2  ORF type:complete len:302 (+),score=117.24 TRINITY_DN11215_c0_g2_i3:82-906(+)
MAAEQLVKYETRGNIAIFTLNRFKDRNAVSAELSEEFEAHLDRFEADDSVWVGIVQSCHPKVFCAGADLKSVNAGKSVQTSKGGFAGFVKYPRTKPLIACVDGAALAGGCEIVLGCDLVVASRKSTFGVPEVKRSLVPAAGGMFRLPQRVPLNVAMELMITGDPMPAERMYHFGLVNVLCEDGQSLAESLKLAERITINAPLAVREARRVTLSTLHMDEKKAFQESVKPMMTLMRTPDFKEGPRAFIEKRKPRWTGIDPIAKKKAQAAAAKAKL